MCYTGGNRVANSDHYVSFMGLYHQDPKVHNVDFWILEQIGDQKESMFGQS
jgi:hypothetical protein